MSLKINYLFIVIALFGIVSAKWNVKLIQHEGGSEVTTLTVNKGFYSTYFLRVDPTDTSNPREKSILRVNLQEDSSFKLSKPVEINTMLGSSFEFNIGIACTSKLKAGEYKVSFTVEGDVDEFIIDSEITIQLGEEKEEVVLEKNIETIPEGEYGFVYIKNTFKNFHDFVIEFTSQEGEIISEVENMNLEAFTDTRGDLNTKLFKFKALKASSNRNERYTFAVQDGSMQQCLSIPSNEFTFITEQQAIPDLNDYREDILNSIEYVRSNANDINFKFKNFPVSPVLMTCIVQSFSYGPELLSAEEIRKINQKSDKLSFSRQYITTSGVDVNAHFIPLSRYETFRGKCIFDTPTNEEADFSSIEITLGDFPGADHRKALDGPLPSIFNPLCASWQFESFVNVDSFVNKFIDVSDEKLLDIENYPYIDDGCTFTKRVNIGQDKSKVQICLVTQENCYTNFHEDFTQTFYELANSVNTAEKIRAVFGFENFVVKEFKEIKYSEIDPKKIGYKLIKKNEKSVLLTIENKDENDYTCFGKSTRINQEMSHFFFDYSDEGKMQIKAGQQADYYIDLQYELKEYDAYPIYLVCYRTDFDYIKKGLSQPFTTYSFIHTNETREDDEPVEKPDCETDKMYPECIKLEKHKFPIEDIESYKVYLPSSSEIELFSKMDENDQRLYVNLKKSIIANDVDTLNHITYLADLLTNMDCATYKNYGKCVEYKTGVLTDIVNKFKEINLADINDSAEFHQYLTALFFILNTPDALNKNTFNTLVEITKKIKENIKQKLEEVDLNKEETAILLMGLANNLLDLPHYIETNNLASIDYFDSSIIQSDKIVGIENCIKTTLALVFKYTQKSYLDLANLKIDYIDIQNTVEEKIITGTNITFKYDQGNFSEIYPDNSIIAVHYIKYPYSSIENTKFFDHFVGLHLLDLNNFALTQPKLDSDLPKPALIYKEYEIGKYLLNIKDKELAKSNANIAYDEDTKTLTGEIKEFGDFTIGPEPKSESGSSSSKKTVIIIVCIVAALLVAVGLFFLIKYLTGKRDGAVDEKMKKTKPLIVDESAKEDDNVKEEV